MFVETQQESVMSKYSREQLDAMDLPGLKGLARSMKVQQIVTMGKQDLVRAILKIQAGGVSRADPDGGSAKAGKKVVEMAAKVAAPQQPSAPIRKPVPTPAGPSPEKKAPPPSSPATKDDPLKAINARVDVLEKRLIALETSAAAATQSDDTEEVQVGPDDLKALPFDKLKAVAKDNKVPFGPKDNKESLLKKLLEAMGVFEEEEEEEEEEEAEEEETVEEDGDASSEEEESDEEEEETEEEEESEEEEVEEDDESSNEWAAEKPIDPSLLKAGLAVRVYSAGEGVCYSKAQVHKSDEDGCDVVVLADDGEEYLLEGIQHRHVYPVKGKPQAKQR